MLAFFKPITVEEAQRQSSAALAASGVQLQADAAAAATAVEKRGPGRPKAERTVDDALAAAAAAAPDADSEPSTHTHKRSKYNNWWASAYIHDILAAFQRHYPNARKAVEELQRAIHDCRRSSTRDSMDLRSQPFAHGTTGVC